MSRTLRATGEHAPNQAATRVLDVLAAFIGHPSPWGVTELSEHLGITKNMAFRALTTLTERGLLIRDASGSAYDLGWRVLGMHGAEPHALDIRALCRPFLEKLHALTHESVFLSVIVGAHQVAIDSFEAHGVRVSYTPSNLMVPLHAGPASRTLLACLLDREVEEYIRAASPLKRFTATTITDPARLREEIALIRQRGYARGYGDHYVGATYLSFPVLDASGRAHAAITIGGPAERLTPKRLDTLLPDIQTTIQALNKQSKLYPVTSTVAFT